MRRLWVKLCRTLAWLSLALALATGAVWIVAGLQLARYSATPISTLQRRLYVQTGPNMLIFDDIRLSPQPIVGPDRNDAQAIAAFVKRFDQPNWIIFPVVRIKTLAGPSFGTTSDRHIRMDGTRVLYAIPYGLLLAIFLLLPAQRWLPPMIRRVRCRFVIPAGCCQNCGYDLRGTPDRCPECGTVSDQSGAEARVT